MSGKRVIELRDVAIYHAENPFGRQSAERLVRSGELVLSEVDFSVEEGEFVYLIGRVGSGKSTLLKTLYADVQLLVGEGCVVGFDLRKLRRRQIPYLRRKIGIVFQDYQLLTDRNVFQNLYYVMRATGWRAEAEIRRRIDEVLQLVGLEAKHYKMPFELSGGEQQRLVIARALLNKPRLLLADEPTAALDVSVQKQVLEELRFVRDTFGTAILLVTHNIGIIRMMADRVLILQNGKEAEYGTTQEVLEHPQAAYTRQLLAAVPKLRRA